MRYFQPLFFSLDALLTPAQIWIIVTNVSLLTFLEAYILLGSGPFPFIVFLVFSCDKALVPSKIFRNIKRANFQQKRNAFRSHQSTPGLFKIFVAAGDDDRCNCAADDPERDNKGRFSAFKESSLFQGC